MKMKRTAVAALVLTLSAAAQAAPEPGQMAFVSLNADEDGFAVATFVDLDAGAEFFFTDSEWNGLAVGAGGGFNTGEGVLSWTLDTDLAAGSVVRFLSVDDRVAISASVGEVTRSGSFSLATTNDAVTLYADLAGVVTPLAAIGNGSGVDLADELTGSGLEALALDLDGRADYAEYTGARSGSDDMSAYAGDVLDIGNWTVRSATDEAGTVPNLTAFSVTAPVPEPETYAMMLAGLGLMSLVARRRT